MDDPTIRGLVGGVLWPGFLGRSIPDPFRRELDEGGLAGLVLFAHNLGDDGERMSLASALRDRDRPLVVGIDEEGGNVTRAESATGSTLPGAAQLGFVDDLAITEAVGAELGRRSLEVGANIVLAPVADVNTDPRNPVIGVRSFGARPDLVARHAIVQARGIRLAGAAAAAKHFPGHGDTHLDSHHAMPTLEIGLDELERTHLPPFQALVDAGVPAIMTAHVVVPAWGPSPSTLNPVALGRLRAMGFEGVIITDALDMAAVRESVGAGPGAVQALLAGADLLCISNPTNLGAAAAPDQDARDFLEVQHALLAAVEDGTLPVPVLERAAARVRTLAASLSTAGGAETAEARGAGVRAAGLGDRDGAGRVDRGGAGLIDRFEPVDAAAVARAAITLDGVVPPTPAPRTVFDLRGRSTLAVASDRDFFETALAAGGAVLRGDAAVPGSGPLVVLVDRVGSDDGEQRGRVANIARIRPDAVVVDVGVPGAPLPLPTAHTRAASRLAADAAAVVLAEGAERVDPAEGAQGAERVDGAPGADAPQSRSAAAAPAPEASP
ncbi:glycoside hydrolase family 3 N-terminal domain-containing protein [Agromyces salentinus]|uniref:Glycoside hydrolase family 3 N-terminal domain-containing protein n=1 Tax=Agromyces salentinus TaxID=269421 RepID=A0ABN2MKZ2_9MICO|nr:glycoside hydrolase family 3 N-terminal domain-containing protein [Agromyces salentinus]